MNKVLSILLFLFILTGEVAFAQDPVISVRVSQASYSSEDPDGAGAATGSVTLIFEWMSSQPVQVEAFGLGAAFQTSHLMAPNPVSNANPTPLGVLAPLGWTISGNYPGNQIIGTITHAGQTYDQRFIVGFSQAATGTTVPITTSWQPIFQVTFWTKGNSYPQGGYVIIEPYSIVPGHSASTDGGFTEYQYASPGFPNNNVALGGTVPVSFASFSATCSPNGALIKWATAQEANSDYFEIERSTDGSNWKTIGRTPAAGTSSARRDYNQIDLEAGNAMYRIKQVDKDGRVTYTDIQRANCEVKNVTTLLYPVPAKDVLNVVIKSDKAVRTQLLVFDITGKLVTRTDANVQNGTNNFRISLTGLSSGEYYIKSTDPDIQLNKKFTVIR